MINYDYYNKLFNILKSTSFDYYCFKQRTFCIY